MTPEGLRKTKQVEKTESISSSTGKKLNRLIIATLIILLGFLGYERFFVHGHEENLNETIVLPSIAVLPFEDMSPNKDQEYFSDGLSEELLNFLAKVNDIKVAGRTSSFKFKGKYDNIKLIGAELDVEHVLEGSVRKSGNKIRITAQLIKVSDGFHMWSETYDKEYTADNLFLIQDEISKKILKELKIKLSIKDTNTKVNVLTSNT
jgi:TolB-like protein